MICWLEVTKLVSKEAEMKTELFKNSYKRRERNKLPLNYPHDNITSVLSGLLAVQVNVKAEYDTHRKWECYYIKLVN